MPLPHHLAAALEQLLAAEAERVENTARRDRLRVEIAELVAAGATGSRYSSPLGLVVIHRVGEALLPQVVDEAAFLAWARTHHPNRIRRYTGDAEEFEDIDPLLAGELAAGGEFRRYADGLVVLFDVAGRVVDGISGVETSFGLEITLTAEAKSAARLAGAGLDPTLAEMQARP